MELVRLVRTTKKPPPPLSIHGKETERSLSQTIIRKKIKDKIALLLEDLYKKGKLRIVDLYPEPGTQHGYGMTMLVRGGIRTIFSMKPNGPADLSKQVFKGDIVLSNNDINLIDASQDTFNKSLAIRNKASLMLIQPDEHIFSFRSRRQKSKTQLKQKGMKNLNVKSKSKKVLIKKKKKSGK